MNKWLIEIRQIIVKKCMGTCDIGCCPYCADVNEEIAKIKNSTEAEAA